MELELVDVLAEETAASFMDESADNSSSRRAAGRKVWFLKKEPVDRGVGPVRSCCR
jgi:hypothetical protein